MFDDLNDQSLQWAKDNFIELAVYNCIALHGL